MKMKKLTNSNIKKFNNVVHLSNDDDEDEPVQANKLGYFRSTQTAQCLDIHITGAIRDAEYYTQVVQAIKNTSEGDLVNFHLNSFGGNLNGLQSLLSAMLSTEAEKRAYIDGGAMSAASILALNCDSVFVSPYAEMLCHFISLSAGGKSSDVKSHFDHIQRTSEKLFRETYQFFLTEEEIEECIEHGRDIWLDAEEIAERLQRKFEIIQELSEQAEQDDQADATSCECNPNDCSITSCAGYSEACIKGKAFSDVLSRLEDTVEENQGVDSHKGSKTRRKASKAV